MKGDFVVDSRLESGAFSRMHGQLCRGLGENEPPAAGIHGFKAKRAAQLQRRASGSDE